MAAGKHEVHAILHGLADVEVVGVHERRGRDAKHVGRRHILGQHTTKELVGH